MCIMEYLFTYPEIKYFFNTAFVLNNAHCLQKPRQLATKVTANRQCKLLLLPSDIRICHPCRASQDGKDFRDCLHHQLAKKNYRQLRSATRLAFASNKRTQRQIHKIHQKSKSVYIPFMPSIRHSELATRPAFYVYFESADENTLNPLIRWQGAEKTVIEKNVLENMICSFQKD